MGKIGENLENHKLKGSNFGYSAIGLKNLGATEYTIVTIIVDRSTSVGSFVNELTECLKRIALACKESKRADNLLVRIVQFGSTMEEVHGFKLLQNINPADYDNAINICGSTALYDASANAILATLDYGKQLTEQDYACNAIVIALTDGDDNQSVLGISAVKDALASAAKNETLESLVSILVAVNIADPHMKDRLDLFHKEAGFTQFVPLADASAKTMAKLAKFVSDSISSVSQSLQTKAPSQPLTI